MNDPTPTKKSWRTTTAGVLALIASLIPAAIALMDGDPATNINMNEVGAALMGFFMAYMGVSARDNVVTSEQAGVKKEEPK